MILSSIAFFFIAQSWYNTAYSSVSVSQAVVVMVVEKDADEVDEVVYAVEKLLGTGTSLLAWVGHHSKRTRGGRNTVVILNGRGVYVGSLRSPSVARRRFAAPRSLSLSLTIK